MIKDFDKIEGLFELYRDPEDNKVFLAIRPDQFDQIHLCSITRTQGDGYFFDSASLVSIGRGWGTFPFVFQRVGKKVFFAHKNVYYRAEPDAAIHRAVDRGLSDSILGVGSIEGQPHPETGAVLVDPSDFFIQDIASVSSFFSRHLKEGSYSFDNDNSYFGALKMLTTETRSPCRKSCGPRSRTNSSRRASATKPCDEYSAGALGLTPQVRAMSAATSAASITTATTWAMDGFRYSRCRPPGSARRSTS